MTWFPEESRVAVECGGTSMNRCMDVTMQGRRGDRSSSSLSTWPEPRAGDVDEPRQQDSGSLSFVPAVGASNPDSDLNSIKHQCPVILVDRSWVQNLGFPTVKTNKIKSLELLEGKSMKAIIL